MGIKDTFNGFVNSTPVNNVNKSAPFVESATHLENQSSSDNTSQQVRINPRGGVSDTEPQMSMRKQAKRKKHSTKRDHGTSAQISVEIIQGKSGRIFDSNGKGINDLSMRNKLMKQCLESGVVGKQTRLRIQESMEQESVVNDAELLAQQLELERQREIKMQRARERKQEEMERRRLERQRVEREAILEQERQELERQEQERAEEERAEEERIERERTEQRRMKIIRRRERRRQRLERARAQYSNSEALPPYTPNLNKYLDVLSFDARFMPVLRFNKSIIKNKRELGNSIKQFHQFGVFPNEIDPFDLNLIDDRFYDDMIPNLISNDTSDTSDDTAPEISDGSPTEALRSSCIGDNLILHDINNYDLGIMRNEEIQLIMKLSLGLNHSLGLSHSLVPEPGSSDTMVPKDSYDTARIQLPHAC